MEKGLRKLFPLGKRHYTSIMLIFFIIICFFLAVFLRVFLWKPLKSEWLEKCVKTGYWYQHLRAWCRRLRYIPSFLDNFHAHVRTTDPVSDCLFTLCTGRGSQHSSAVFCTPNSRKVFLKYICKRIKLVDKIPFRGWQSFYTHIFSWFSAGWSKITCFTFHSYSRVFLCIKLQSKFLESKNVFNTRV